jgi:drug/metabolite transporter (DMT)-like permease
MSKASHEQETTRRLTPDLLTSIGIWFSTLCWGSAYVAARFLLHPEIAGVVVLNPLMLAALRFSIASLFFVVPLARGVIRHEITGRHLLLMALLGQLTFSLYYWLQYIGIEQTNASISSILGVGLIPLFTTLIAQVSGAERRQIPLLGALILGVIGVALVVFEQPLHAPLQSGFLIGSLCLIANTFFFAVYSNLSKRWMQDIPPIVMTGGTMVSGAIGLLLLSLLDPANNQWSQITLLNTSQWFALLFLAIGCSVLAYFAYNFALSKRDASRVAVYFYFEPVIATILGVTLLDEHLTWQVIMGAVTIGLSVIIVNVMKK